MTITKLSEYNGITIDNIWEGKLLNRLKPLGSNSMVRLVVDETTEDFVRAYTSLSLKTKVMLQAIDSFRDGQTNDRDFVARLAWLIRNFAGCEIVEVANEIGPASDWLSKDALFRAQLSSMVWEGFHRVVTLFWPGPDHDLEKWWKENRVPCETVLLSFYPHKMSDFDHAEKLIKSGLVAGLGECGMHEWEGKFTKDEEAEVRARAYEIGKPVFWWNMRDEDSK